MGVNNLSTKKPGDKNSEDDLNQYFGALSGNFVPRNSSGFPEDIAATIGSAELEWARGNIKNGYWNVGDIKAHHSFNGTLPVDQGWFPCDGSIINETNYDAIHGSGSWTEFISSSVFDSKYSPNMIDKYLVGANSTTADGTTAIPSVGNTNNETNIQHLHVDVDHNHQWHTDTAVSGGYATGIGANGGGQDSSFDANGNYQNLSYVTFSTASKISGNYYTAKSGGITNYSGSTSQTIQPESIEVIYYIRII